MTNMLSNWLEQQKQQGLLCHQDSEQAALQLLLMWQGKERMLRELGLPLTQSAAEQDAWTLSCVDLFLTAAAPRKNNGGGNEPHSDRCPAQVAAPAGGGRFLYAGAGWHHSQHRPAQHGRDLGRARCRCSR